MKKLLAVVFCLLFGFSFQPFSDTDFSESEADFTQGLAILFKETFSIPMGEKRYSEYTASLIMPTKGPAGFLRQWEPGLIGNGSNDYSRLFIAQNRLQANYSGNIGGVCSQDELVYPIGDLISATKGFIEFDYCPHYDSRDESALIYIISSKNNLDNPNAIEKEVLAGVSFIEFSYQGWSGRKFFCFLIGERTQADNSQNYDSKLILILKTPNEFSSSAINFEKDKWLNIKLIWNNKGIKFFAGATAVILLNNKVVAETKERFTSMLPLDKWLVFGAQAASPWEKGSYLKNYSGLSGDLDNIIIYKY